MLNIPVEIKEKLKTNTAPKNFRVTFPNGERADIINDNIVFESVRFTESVMSQDKFKLGLCESPVIEFEAFGIENIKGKKIECYYEIYCASTVEDAVYREDLDAYVYPIPLGVFYVDSCQKEAKMNIRQAIAYGMQAYFEWKPNYRDITYPCDFDEYIAVTLQTTELLNNTSFVSYSGNYKIQKRLDYESTAQGSRYTYYGAGINFEYSVSGIKYLGYASHLYGNSDEIVTIPYVYTDTNGTPLTATKSVLTFGQQRRYRDTLAYGANKVSLFSVGKYNTIERLNDMVSELIAPYLAHSQEQPLLPYRIKHLDVDTIQFAGLVIEGKKMQEALNAPGHSAVDMFYDSFGMKNPLTKLYGTNPSLYIRNSAHTSDYKVQLRQDYEFAKYRLYVNWNPNPSSGEYIEVSSTNGFHCLSDFAEFYYRNHSGGNPSAWLNMFTLIDETDWLNGAENQEQQIGYYNYDISGRTLTSESDVSSDVVKKYVEDVLESQGKLGRFDREGNFESFTIDTATLVPNDTDLVPSESLVPNGADVDTIYPSEYETAWYDDELSLPYGACAANHKVSGTDTYTIVYADGYDADTDPSTYQIYDISNNDLIKEMTVEEITPILTTIITNLSNLRYMPSDIDMVGRPDIEAGDGIQVMSNSGAFNTYVLSRTTDGIQGLSDTITAK